MSGDLISPYSYEMVEITREGAWPLLGDFLVSDELRENINQINAWRVRLNEWVAWINVLEKYDEQERWSLQMHLVEPIVHTCLLYPSSTRDRFGKAITNSIHLANLRTDGDYRDVLDEDALKPGRYLSRGKIEDQIKRIGASWGEAGALMSSLQRIDSKEYKLATRNYRDLSSHAIAPRLGFGEVNLVKRKMGVWEEWQDQGDGTRKLVPNSARRTVSYSFGGTPPLELVEIYRLNKEQHEIAADTLEKYCGLLNELLAALGEKSN